VRIGRCQASEEADLHLQVGFFVLCETSDCSDYWWSH